jgi:MFS family permease
MWIPLRHKAFRFLVAGRTVSVLGNTIAPIALAFAVLDLTGSATDLGLVVGARSLANVLLLLFGGVVADRFPRHLVLVVSSALAMLTRSVVAGLVLTGSPSVPLLMGLSAINGAVAAFALPASSAMLPQTVPAEVRQSANALNRLGSNAAMIVGAAAAGILVASFGPGWGIAIDAITFGLAAALYAFIRVPAYRDSAASAGVLTELREGWSEFTARSWVWVVVLGACFLNAALAGALNVLGPTIADDTFGRQVWGVLLATQTAGMVAGAFVAMRLRVRRMLLVGVVSCLSCSLWLFGLALWPEVAILLPAAFVTGVAVEQFGVAWEVSIQEHIPPDRLARVYSYDLVGSFLAIPFGQVAAGPLAEAVGPSAALLGAAVVVVLALVGILLSHEVRTLEHTPHQAARDTAEPALAT